MIDLNNVKKEFNKYVQQFNLNDGRIKLKIEHIQRVAEISKIIAQNLNLDQEHIILAETIGYFHDIGRFKQVQIYDTFSDKDSINHAELSVRVLLDDKLIEQCNIEERYQDIIKISILNHNKNKIQEGLSKEEKLFAEIIRDADKLDICHTLCDYDLESIFWYKNFNCDKINDVIINQFINEHAINYKDIENNADQIIAYYAYIYDFNFKFSLNYLVNNKYLEKFTERIYRKFSSHQVFKQVKEIFKIVEDYLQQFKYIEE